jgi:hypothetical protein
MVGFRKRQTAANTLPSATLNAFESDTNLGV